MGPRLVSWPQAEEGRGDLIRVRKGSLFPGHGGWAGRGGWAHFRDKTIRFLLVGGTPTREEALP